LLATISKTKSEAMYDMDLALTNGTSSNCQMNNQTETGLCLDNEYYYMCNKSYSNDEYNNMYFNCILQQEDINCYDKYLDGEGDSDITFYCMHEYLNIEDFVEDECIFTTYEDGVPSTNKNNTLVCFAVTEISENPVETTKSSIHVFGIKITRYIAKILVIALIVAVGIILCCFGLCCYSCCKDKCYNKSSTQRYYTSSQHHSSQHHSSCQNQRYPQSSCNI